MVVVDSATLGAKDKMFRWYLFTGRPPKRSPFDDDDVVPRNPGHSESFGLGYVLCVVVSFICLLSSKPVVLPPQLQNF